MFCRNEYESHIHVQKAFNWLGVEFEERLDCLLISIWNNHFRNVSETDDVMLPLLILLSLSIEINSRACLRFISPRDKISVLALNCTESEIMRWKHHKPVHRHILIFFFYTADAYLAYVGHTESMELKIRWSPELAKDHLLLGKQTYISSSNGWLCLYNNTNTNVTAGLITSLEWGCYSLNCNLLSGEFEVKCTYEINSEWLGFR